MFKSRITLMALLFGPAIVLLGACTTAPVGSQTGGQQVAEEFVKMEATFRFDGMPETLKLTGTTSVANGWEYTYEFDSRHAGYGNRTGQVLAQVITHHKAVVRVEGGRVTTGVMDGKWDMVKTQMLP